VRSFLFGGGGGSQTHDLSVANAFEKKNQETPKKTLCNKVRGFNPIIGEPGKTRKNGDRFSHLLPKCYPSELFDVQKKQYNSNYLHKFVHTVLLLLNSSF
jgi:hypothetical protein